MREFQNKQKIGGRKLWGNFSRNLGAGGNYGGIFLRNLEKICAHFQKTILAGGNYREISCQNLEKRCAKYWRQETLGEFFQKFGEDMREFQKAILAGGNDG